MPTISPDLPFLLFPLLVFAATITLRWAFAEAAVLFIRQSQSGKAYCMKLEHTHGKARALIVLAHKLGRAVYYRLTREQAFDLNRFVTA